MSAQLACRPLGKPFADLRNTFAGALISANLPAGDAQDAPQLRLETPLPAYALVGEWRGSHGSLRIGLELGALCHAYAPDVIARVAPDPSALRDWLDWMLSPWLGMLEEHLGSTFTLQSARTHAALPGDCLAFAL